MIKQDLRHWFNTLSLEDRSQVQKFMLVLYCIGDIQNAKD